MYVYGKQPVYEALISKHPIKKVFLAYELERKDIENISTLAEKKAIPADFLPKSKLQNLCGPVPHQGIVAQLDYYHYIAKDKIIKLTSTARPSLILILDQIQDPHNLGAIIRTAEVAGITLIVIPEKGSAEVNATVAKTSSGAIFHVPIYREENLLSFLGYLTTLNIQRVALVPGGPHSIYDADLTGNLAIIIGSEGKGVRKNLQKHCELKLSIPGRGKVASLNASVSTAVVLFEAVRQRGLC
jgi:23S rRNA (guanosine2251-2'-O)-methyltransferase